MKKNKASKKLKAKKTDSEISVNKKASTAFWITAATLFTVVAASAFYFLTKPIPAGEPISVQVERAPDQLVETRPVLPASQFSGKIATAYRYAAEIPMVIDQQYCYCHCKKSFGHKTLLTCFIDKHGAMCGICQNEVIRSYSLYKQGVPLPEIKKTIDREFKSGHS